MAPERLPCGAVTRAVRAGAFDEPGIGDAAGHGPSCPHCTAVRAERRARWEQARTELADQHRPPPPHVGRAVARRVRAGRTGRRVEVASDGPGQTLLSEAVVAEVVARAAGSVAGVAELREVEVTSLSGSEVDLVVRLVADLDWRRPLGSVAGSVRHAVRSRLAAVAAVAVGRIDVEVAAAIAPAASTDRA